MIKNIKNQSDYFFPEIPKWVTHYGFALMLLLLLGFLVAASLIRYSDNQQFQVIVTKNSKLARLNFALYRKLKNEQAIMVSGPFRHAVSGYLQKTIVSAKDNYVVVPVIIPDSALNSLPIDGQLLLSGSFRIYKGSLLENLVKSN